SLAKQSKFFRASTASSAPRALSVDTVARCDLQARRSLPKWRFARWRLKSAIAWECFKVESNSAAAESEAIMSKASPVLACASEIGLLRCAEVKPSAGQLVVSGLSRCCCQGHGK